ncbi:MAG: 23S rRNA (adenine(2503)-C(2))-methyltransferase RlmN [Myxococcales bacterium]|nr:23S rRNA (adenine(2503)-C(2))-methyltransferase RlmN [Myxococcales bacterium]
MTAALSPPQSLLERLPHEWEELFAGWGQPRYRARQVFAWIHQRGILEPQAMTDLPGPLRLRLAQEGLAPPLTVVADQVSSDGTRKLLVEMVDGQRVETVLIPRGSVAERDVYAPPQDDDGDSDDEPDPAATEAYSQCISSQVGCAMGCAFCASGIAGLKRQMTAGEIYAQVLLGRARLEGQRRQSGIVFMGMGEPLHNYPAVARVLELLRTAEGFGMSLRRVTVSTSGLIPELRQLAEDFGGRVRLAVSVHASDSASRSRIMPINRRYPLPDLLAALREYPVPGLGRITIEYTLLGGDNDSDGDAVRLSEQLAGLPVKVNLIPVNPVPEAAFPAPSEARVASFQRILRARGLDTFVRRRKGDDIAAACGQLALHGEKRKVRVL